ncbi:MAG: PSD1 and planctomycete cytochrome C domain-containing protein [Chthoniobacteraceae bacterium]
MKPKLKFILSGAIALAVPDFAPAAEKVSFNRDIRPILSDICFTCHGPDVSKIKGGLRLDNKESAMKGGESGPAIVPGKPEESEVYKRLITHDADDFMPPKKSGKTLKPEQVDAFRRWIAEGAEYQGHWSFIKPERPAVPTKAANPIDAFVLARLEKENLKPQLEAPKETLIRRVTLDLTGIPPTPAEVDAFLADKSPDAYGKLADRVLSSPRYGEHMAARWLDYARYADSNGFQSDTQRHMWHWRDWVINAYNQNKPFDQFTIEQLAGDLIPNAQRDQIVATGFNRNHRLNGEGGRIVEEWFAETVIDRVETTGLTWMALTFNCCRCHDHKYDPISQKEFYQLFAFFNSNNENGVLDDFGGAGRTRRGGNSRPVLALPSPEQEAQIAKLEKSVKDAEAGVTAANKELAAAQTAWEPKFRAEMQRGMKPWTMLEPKEVRSDGGATFSKQADGSYLASGINPPFDQYLIVSPIPQGTFSGLLLEVFPDDSLPNKSLGRNSNGNFVLTDVIAEINAPGLAKPMRATFTRAEADYNQKGYEVGLIVQGVQEKPARGKGGKKSQGWAIDGPTKRDARKAMFIAGTPLTVPPNATLSVTLRHDSIANHNIGRFRLSMTSLPPATVKIDGAKVAPSIMAAIDTEPAKRTPAQRTELAKFFRENADNPAKRAEAAVAAAKKSLDAVYADVSSTMVMEELPQPKEARLLKRGEYDKPGDAVPRALPAVFPPLPAGAPNNRLGFAKWLVSGEHPLTARVWVNREWERFFGTGLVKTSENLGSQAEWPSHPELLDWLATEFVRLKWDMKAMQKLIVMSATYRQSSRVTPELIAKDPENRLLARGPRFRLGAESLRDQALAISGLLVEKIGGPSVKPYMPAAVWDETSVYGDMRNYKEDAGEGLYRRTLYTIWKRTAAPPTMTMFDSPSREICTVKRSRTNTPLQALALLNEKTYIEAARVLAQRMIAEGGSTPEQRIAWAFRRATSRAPRADELQVLVAGLAKRTARFQQSPEEAAKILAVGEAKPDAKLNPIELAAYTFTANVLLNLDEVVTRE